MALFRGLDDAFGTGRGQWIDRAPEKSDFASHLGGHGDGVGIAPLMRDGSINFAAIDLDEPDFEAAQAMQKFLPGPSFIERSRSGNAHVWVFFEGPIEAWVVRGIMKEATLAAGKRGVEIFPKQDLWHDSLKRGSYINLPYHGLNRPVIAMWRMTKSLMNDVTWHHYYTPEGFVEAAAKAKNSADAWRKRARWLQVSAPSDRESTSSFGDQRELHMCAEWIIANRDENPVTDGHRNVVYFNLAKMLLNYQGFTEDEAWSMMNLVNESSPDEVNEYELRRIFTNAKRGEWTSTGCDDPLMEPYTHPSCKIAHPERH
jgi:hypothetical protein